jgi:hypothetical protein
MRESRAMRSPTLPSTTASRQNMSTQIAHMGMYKPNIQLDLEEAPPMGGLSSQTRDQFVRPALGSVLQLDSDG